MTAPLPPPDKYLPWYLIPEPERDAILAYARQAVREALERAKRKFLVENDFPRNTIRTNTAHDCAKLIDTMIEDYK